MEDAPTAAIGGGGYCYGGQHPVDTRVVEGPAWDETQGTHLHPYPPFDLRLFVLRDGCYHFVGDPTDFGYRGRTYSYYGAHPVLDHYGGGWCFMIAGHSHWWRPWSPYFTVAGPWYYWHGPYDPFFWSHWPYYAHYYRAYYPRYYGGGRFYRGSRHERAVAPPVGRMPGRPARAMAAAPSGAFSSGAPPARGRPAAPARGSWSGSPGWSSPTQANGGGDVPSVNWSGRSATARPVAPPTSALPGRDQSGFSASPERAFRGQPAPTYRGDVSGSSGGFRNPAPAQSAPMFRSSPTPSYRSAPAASPSFRSSAPAAPSFRSAPAPSFRSAPAPSFRSGGSSSSAPSFRSGGGSSGGGWRSR